MQQVLARSGQEPRLSVRAVGKNQLPGRNARVTRKDHSEQTAPGNKTGAVPFEPETIRPAPFVRRQTGFKLRPARRQRIEPDSPEMDFAFGQRRRLRRRLPREFSGREAGLVEGKER